MTPRLIPIVLVIFAIAVVFAYIRPTFNGAIATTKTQIASDESALDAAKQFQSKETELTQEQAKIPPNSLERLAAFLPDGVDNVQLILDLNALAARSGVTLSSFNISDSKGSGSSNDNSSANLPLTNGSNVDSLDITFSATGSYPAFRTFLAGIEQSLRPLDVTSLTVNVSDNGVYTYNMTVRLYWLK